MKVHASQHLGLQHGGAITSPQPVEGSWWLPNICCWRTRSGLKRSETHILMSHLAGPLNQSGNDSGSD